MKKILLGLVGIFAFSGFAFAVTNLKPGHYSCNYYYNDANAGKCKLVQCNE